ncbi:type II secretion system protein [Planctomycetales bacterium ZRK34]|nr:type II secretion system protein [Planctomycetales bacterium ZRK34]
MDQTFHSSDGQAKRGAFTLIELLVVVAIIAMLIAILLPSLAKARQTAKEVTCGVDIRTLVQVCSIYAHDYKGHLPRFQYNPDSEHNHIYPYWSYPHWRDLFEKTYGLQRKHWYSPNNEVWNHDYLYYWNTGVRETATNMVMGRFYLCSSGTVDKPALLNYIADPMLGTGATVFATKLSDKSQVKVMWSDLNRMSGGRFVNGGNRWGSNHIYDPDTNFPVGNHLGYLDGSVEWVQPNEIKLRVDYVGIQLYW